VRLGWMKHRMRQGHGAQGDQSFEKLRPEAELLLCTARTSMDAPAAARIRPLLSGAFDWDCLVETALRHGTIPLLYWQLSHTCPDAVPNALRMPDQSAPAPVTRTTSFDAPHQLAMKKAS